MSEFEDRLNNILSSPEQMGKIMEIAKSLNIKAPESNSEKNSFENIKSGLNASEGIDPKLLRLLIRLMQEFDKGDTAKRELIKSLKPFLNPSKREQLDRAYKLTRMASAAKTIISSSEGGDLRV